MIGYGGLMKGVRVGRQTHSNWEFKFKFGIQGEGLQRWPLPGPELTEVPSPNSEFEFRIQNLNAFA